MSKMTPEYIFLTGLGDPPAEILWNPDRIDHETDVMYVRLDIAEGMVAAAVARLRSGEAVQPSESLT